MSESKRIKCGALDCSESIIVPNNFKEATRLMNKNKWRKLGYCLSWDYFCPKHNSYVESKKMLVSHD